METNNETIDLKNATLTILNPDTNPMRIWDVVEETDARHTKKFDNGTFKGTSINPEYTIKRATQLWGPVGFGWGFEIVKDEILDVQPIHDKDGTLIAMERLHTVDVKVWYLDAGRCCEVLGRGHTPFVYKTNKGTVMVDREFGKKTITDAIGKALSFLGFGADIRMGLFDMPDYLEAQRQQQELEEAEDAAATAVQQRQEFEDWLANAINLMKTALGMRELEVIYKSTEPRVTRQGTDAQLKEFNDAKTSAGLAILRKQKAAEKEAANGGNTAPV